MKRTTTYPLLVAKIIFAAMLLVGCAQQSPTLILSNPPPPPAVEIGPQLELLPEAASTSAIIMDSQQHAHLIYASPKTNEVRHLVIGNSGVISSETVSAGLKPISLDLAFDRNNTLHALIDDEHFVQKNSVWLGKQRTPWKEANLHVMPKEVRDHPAFSDEALYEFSATIRMPGFAKGSQDLVWLFSVGSNDLGIPRRLDLGPLPFLMIMNRQIEKLLVVPEEAQTYRNWMLIGAEDNLDLTGVNLQLDQQGYIHTLYRSVSPSRTSSIRVASSSINEPCLQPPDMHHTDVEEEPNGMTTPAFKNGTIPCPVKGIPLTRIEASVPIDRGSKKILMQAEMAALVPGTSDMLVVANGISSVLHDNAWTHPAQTPLKHADWFMTPAGDKNLHALAIGRQYAKPPATKSADFDAPGSQTQKPMDNYVYYMNYSAASGWSGPITVARIDGIQPTYLPGCLNELHYCHAEPVAKIASAGGKQSFVIWHTQSATYGRWISLK